MDLVRDGDKRVANMVFRASWGRNSGKWYALDPYSSNYAAFKTRAEAFKAYNGFISQRNADLIGGATHAVADTLDSVSAISLARPTANACNGFGRNAP